ncbi:MAG: hypothetical protein IEMM0008_1478 [bacterium]|nr:MAG: hypothetical protein IEMM0008_1478 [bacterium]
MRSYSFLSDKLQVLVAIFFVTIMSSCSNSLEPDAHKVLKNAMEQLKAKNPKGFVQHFIPAQKTMKKYVDFALRSKYFLEMTRYSYDPKDVYEVEKDSARVFVTFHYPKGYIGTFLVYLKKLNNKWYIDFKESYDSEKRINSIHPWMLIKFINK